MVAANKTQPTTISVKAFVDAIEDDQRRADATALIKLMRRATGKPAVMWGSSIIGFDAYHYIYESGREGDMPIVGFSPRKPATVVYGVASFPGADALRAKLGSHTTGKGCLYIKKLEDIDERVFERMIVKAVAARKAK
jgi:hypothetical protein